MRIILASVFAITSICAAEEAVKPPKAPPEFVATETARVEIVRPVAKAVAKSERNRELDEMAAEIAKNEKKLKTIKAKYEKTKEKLKHPIINSGTNAEDRVTRSEMKTISDEYDRLKAQNNAVEDTLQRAKGEKLLPRKLIAMEGERNYTTQNFVVEENQVVVKWNAAAEGIFSLSIHRVDGSLVNLAFADRGYKVLSKPGTYYVEVKAYGAWAFNVERLDE